jgi:hypothetical protein
VIDVSTVHEDDFVSVTLAVVRSGEQDLTAGRVPIAFLDREASHFQAKSGVTDPTSELL